MTTKANAKKKPGRKRQGIRLGLHDETALGAMFRLGGCTADQLQELLPVGRTSTRSVLRRLLDSGLVDQTVDLARWQPRDGMGGQPPAYYYLSNKYSSRAIEYGAYLCGVERKKEAMALYKLHQLPARAAHGSLRNSYYLALLAEAAEAGAEVTWDEMWGESHPDHPLLAGEISREQLGKQPRKNARKNPRRRLYPDGSFEVAFGGGEPTTVMLEVETYVRAAKLVGKVGDYAGWLHKESLIRPLVILGRTQRKAESMRRLLREGIQAGAKGGSTEVGYYASWVRALRQYGVQPAELIVVSSTDEVDEAGAYEAIYRPLSGEESRGISLRELARRAEAAREKLGAKEVA